MSLGIRTWLLISLFSIGVVPAFSQASMQQDHVVSRSELHQAVRGAAETRQANLAKIEKLFTTDAAKQAFDAIKVDGAKVSRAVALLSDNELANLAARSERLQADVTAGALNNQQITYILIALATAVIILVIVAA
jgi:hypothetical protein